MLVLLPIIPSEKNPRCFRPHPDGQGNPSGASAALTIKELADWRIGSSFRRFSMGTLAACVITVSLGMGALAQDLNRLKAGQYVIKEIGCTGGGSAASITFDGRNLSGHYQVCRTEPISRNRYRSTCIESQGLDRRTIDQINADPDQTVIEQSIVVRSAGEVVVDGVVYGLCTR